MSLETMELDVREIKKVMNGNGELGMCAKLQILWENRKTKMGLLDWAFRITISIVLTYIAYKVGMTG